MKKIYYDGSNKSIKRIAEILNTKPEVGENHEDAYYGDYGKTAYLHSQLQSGNPHNVTLSDLGIADIGSRVSLLEGNYIALEARVAALEAEQQDKSYIIKKINGITQYNTLYLNNIWAVYSQDATTQQNIENLQNGTFMTGSGTIWRMISGVIRPTATNWFRAMTFTHPITLTNETTLKLRYSYSTSSTYRIFWVSLWKNVDPSTILTQSFGTGELASDVYNVIIPSSPAQADSTVFSADVSALQGETIWIHLFTTDVIPLIAEIWFE